MNRLISAAAVFLAVAASGVAAGEESASGKFEIGIWQVSPGFATVPDPSEKNGERKLLPGFQLQEGIRGVRYDASGYFKQNAGIDLPPSGEIFYDSWTHTIVARGPTEAVDLIEAVVDACAGLGVAPLNLSVEVAVFECKLGVPSGSAPLQWPVFSDLQKLPPADMVCLDRISTLTKSGGHGRLSRTSSSAPDPSTPASSAGSGKAGDEALSFRPGEVGLKVEVACVVGGDGVSFDNRVDFHFRDPKQKLLPELSFGTSYAGWDGYPTVVQVAPSPTSPDRSIVVVVTVNIVNPGGWRFYDQTSSRKTPARLREAGDVLRPAPAPSRIGD